MARSTQLQIDLDEYDLSDEEEDASFAGFMGRLAEQQQVGNQELLSRYQLSGPSTPSVNPAPSVTPAPVLDPKLGMFQTAYNKSRFYHSTAGENVPSLLEHGLSKDRGKDKGLDAQHRLALQPGFNFLGGDRDTAKYYRGQVGKGADTVRAFVDAEDYEYMMDDLGSDSLAGYKTTRDVPPEKMLYGTFADNQDRDLSPIYDAIRSHLPEEMRTMSPEEVAELHRQAIAAGALTHVPGQSNGKPEFRQARKRFPWNEDGYNSE